MKPIRLAAVLAALIFASGNVLAQSSLAAAALGLAGPGGLKIVQIMDPEGTLSYEILDDEIVNLMKKDLNDRYKEAKNSWTEARKAWKEKYPTIPFVMPKPLNPKVTIVKKGYESRSEAEADLSMVQEAGPFSIIEVVNGEQKKIKIVSAEEVPGVKYGVEQEYHQSLVAWIDDKTASEAEDQDRDFDEPMPRKPKVRVLKSNIKTMDKASDLVAKYAD